MVKNWYSYTSLLKVIPALALLVMLLLKLDYHKMLYEEALR